MLEPLALLAPRGSLPTAVELEGVGPRNGHIVVHSGQSLCTTAGMLPPEHHRYTTHAPESNAEGMVWERMRNKEQSPWQQGQGPSRGASQGTSYLQFGAEQGRVFTGCHPWAAFTIVHCPTPDSYHRTACGAVRCPYTSCIIAIIRRWSSPWASHPQQSQIGAKIWGAWTTIHLVPGCTLDKGEGGAPRHLVWGMWQTMMGRFAAPMLMPTSISLTHSDLLSAS